MSGGTGAYDHEDYYIQKERLAMKIMSRIRNTKC